MYEERMFPLSQFDGLKCEMPFYLPTSEVINVTFYNPYNEEIYISINGGELSRLSVGNNLVTSPTTMCTVFALCPDDYPDPVITFPMLGKYAFLIGFYTDEDE